MKKLSSENSNLKIKIDQYENYEGKNYFFDA